MIKRSIELLNGATADVTVVHRGAIPQRSGTWKLAAWGTFDSGTCKIQERTNGQTFGDVSGASLTADGCVDVAFDDAAEDFQVVLTGATSPDLSAVLFLWE